MTARRGNHTRIKQNRSYEVAELAALCGTHKNTIRNWQREGLEPLCKGKPLLFHGSDVRTFLAKRRASRKRPCAPGMLYCLRCRTPRAPALGMVELHAINVTSGNLKALCDVCTTVMHRRVALSRLDQTMPGIEVQTMRAEPRLNGSTSFPVNCNDDRR